MVGMNVKQVKCLEGKIAIKIKTSKLHRLFEQLPEIYPMKQTSVDS